MGTNPPIKFLYIAFFGASGSLNAIGKKIWRAFRKKNYFRRNLFLICDNLLRFLRVLKVNARVQHLNSCKQKKIIMRIIFFFVAIE